MSCSLKMKPSSSSYSGLYANLTSRNRIGMKILDDLAMRCKKMNMSRINSFKKLDQGGVTTIIIFCSHCFFFFIRYMSGHCQLYL